MANGRYHRIRPIADDPAGAGRTFLLWPGHDGRFWELLYLLTIVGGMAFLMRGAFVCRHRHGCGSGVSDNGSAVIKLLGERYAHGEIGRDEYLEKRSDLEK